MTSSRCRSVRGMVVRPWVLRWSVISCSYVLASLFVLTDRIMRIPLIMSASA
ncbi:MAG: hypothetical protein WCG36_09205 [bacterium]